MFTFGENLINKTTQKFTTPILENGIFTSEQEIKREGQFSLKYKAKTKDFDSDYLESGMSLSEAEIIEKKTLKLPEGLILNTEFSGPDSTNNRKLNDSNSSDDFSVEQQIDIPKFQKEMSQYSSNSSVNLSDRSFVKHSKRKLAPLAIPAKNHRLKQVFSFDSDRSFDSSPSIDMRDQYKKQIEPENLIELGEISDRDKDKESDSSDFEIDGAMKEPAKTQVLLMSGTPKEISIDLDSSSSPKTTKVKEKNIDIISPLSMDLKHLENKGTEGNNDNKSSSSSSEYHFSPEKSPLPAIGLLESSGSETESNYSLDDPKEKAAMYNLVEVSSGGIRNTQVLPYENKVIDHKSQKKESLIKKNKKIIESPQDISDSNNLKQQSPKKDINIAIEELPKQDNIDKLSGHKATYTGVPRVVPPFINENFPQKEIKDEDFGFESPRAVEIPKISENASSKNLLPSRSKKSIHLLKVNSRAEIKDNQKNTKRPTVLKNLTTKCFSCKSW